MLLQSGVDETWWAGSMECYCYLRNVKELLADGEHLYERRFVEPFKGQVNLLGAMVEYYPISARVTNLARKFYLEYSSIDGRIWKGDILVEDMEQLEKINASENLFTKTQCKRSVRDVPEDQNHKGPVQKTYWQSRTSCGTF